MGACAVDFGKRQRDRIQNDKVLGPSTFRFAYLEHNADAARAWLHNEAEVIDTTDITPDQAAQQIADSVLFSKSAEH